MATRPILIVCLLLLLVGCIASTSPVAPVESTFTANEQDHLSGKIQLSGSSTLAPLVVEIAKRFEQKYPNVRLDVQTGGSSRGITDARTGAVEIGMSSRELKDSEQEGLTTWPIAIDGVCFIVHRDNPVTLLAREQLKSILTGSVRNWEEVGGPAGPITMVQRAAGRSEVELITQFFEIKERDFHASLIAGENQQALKMVASDRHAITYLSVGASEYEAEHGTPIRLLPLDDIPASKMMVAQGSYPMSRPLLFVTKVETSPLVRTFIDYCRAADVHDLVEEFSYVPIAE